MTTMGDLPQDLVGEIFSRVPLTSLSAVRSTCKKWNDISKNQIFGKATSMKQFLGFVTMNSKVFSIKLDLREIRNDENFIKPSIKQLSIFNQVGISNIFHCDGLLLCVTQDNTRLVVWNPYLGSRRWIQPRSRLYDLDMYALGYDNKRNHKILRIFGEHHRNVGYELYDFNSHSWRFFNIDADWYIRYNQRGVSLNGNTYFLAQEKIKKSGLGLGEITIKSNDCFIICFDFTTEKFGPCLPLPFDNTHFVTLSCVREEKLAVLYKRWDVTCQLIFEIWVTNKIDHPNALSWSSYLKPLTTDFSIFFNVGSFFIDEEKKVVVVFDLCMLNKTSSCGKAYIIGEDGYFKPMVIKKPDKFYSDQYIFGPLLMCSSYEPSLVQLQINQLHWQEERKIVIISFIYYYILSLFLITVFHYFKSF